MGVFDSQWTAAATLAGGERVSFRPLTSADELGVRAALAELSDESRLRRFFTPAVDLDALARRLVDVDQVDHVAIVALLESVDLKSERGVGVARFIRLAESPHIAEAAITVVDEMQGKGLGRLLLTTLIGIARTRGVTTFRAEVMKRNEPVREALIQAGARVVEEVDGSLVFDFPLRDDDAGSRLLAIVRDLSSKLLAVVRPT